MPPIVVQTDKPINPAAAKADGSEPQTAQDLNTNRYAPPTTTSTEESYTPARPGAPAVPAPTGAANPSSQQYPQPTPTQPLPSSSIGGPPPPQPGAVPIPSQSLSDVPTTRSIPPPPKPGEYVPQNATPPQPEPTADATTSSQHMPPQFSQPPPSMNQAPTYSTNPQSSSYAPPQAGSTTLVSVQPDPPFVGNQAPQQHPTGYQQNPNADRLTSAQRDAAQQQENSSMSGMIPNFGSGNGMSDQSGVGGAWDSAKKWMGDVAGKVGELEGEMWKRVNNNDK